MARNAQPASRNAEAGGMSADGRLPLSERSSNEASPPCGLAPKSANAPASKSPSKKLSSPQKPRTQLVAKTPSKGQKQRSLNLASANSLLLPTARVGGASQRSPGKSASVGLQAASGRASPSRRAKAVAQYALRRDSDDDEDVDVDDSEWHGSPAGGDSSDEDGAGLEQRLPTASLSKSAKRLRLPFQPATPRRQASAEFTGLLFSDDDSEADVAAPATIKAPAARPPTDSESETSAIIRFSPPRIKSPAKTGPELRPATPPQSPSKSKLTSPKKSAFKIPPTPHRPSLDAFWSADVVNTWNEQHSPRKSIKSPRKIPLSESSSEDEDTELSSTVSPLKLSPSKRNKEAIEARKKFERERVQVADEFLRDLDARITEGSISRLTESTGGVKIIWSKKLNSTAGRANWKREAVKCRAPDGTVHATTHRHVASIELADKVIDNEHRLLNVLAHEFCHLANFMLSHKLSSPHGASFKRWAAHVTAEFADRGVCVTTKHSYSISYKYAWACEACGVEYQRHSRSIDPVRHACGKCRGRLAQVRPAPRAGAAGEGSPKKSDYQVFVSGMFGQVKRELGPASPMKDVMKELGARYRAEKQAAASRAAEEEVRAEDDDARVSVVETGDGETGVELRPEPGVDVDNVARVLNFLSLGKE